MSDLDLPPFPVDDQTLDLLREALRTGPEKPRSSIDDLCQMYSELGGSDTDAVEDEIGDIRVMRDPCYHPNDIIAALVAEVRRLRAEAA